MEPNRNVEFDSGVEIDSLKDAVWRLTTRVYLLEDFIAEKFGEVISPGGFTKATPSSGKSTPIRNSVCGNSSSNSASKRKRRKRGSATTSCDMEEQSHKIQKATEETENNEGNSEESPNGENTAILGLEMIQSRDDFPLVPKDEVIVSDNEDDGDTNDSFLNEGSDTYEDANDPLENDSEHISSPPVPVSDVGFSEAYNGEQYYPSTMTTDKKFDVREKPFPCTVCEKSFSIQYQLAEHFRTHTGEKPFVCTICGKGFLQASNLKRHCMVHAGRKPFSCPDPDCEKTFTTQQQLNNHSRIHTGEKPFVCKFCGKRFTQSSTLIIHARTHTGERPFQCTVCEKAFTHQTNLVDHFRIHTGEKPFQCSVCAKRFSDPSNYKRHMKTHKTD